MSLFLPPCTPPGDFVILFLLAELINPICVLFGVLTRRPGETGFTSLRGGEPAASFKFSLPVVVKIYT